MAGNKTAGPNAGPIRAPHPSVPGEAGPVNSFDPATFCPNCGRENDLHGDLTHCPHCGEPQRGNVFERQDDLGLHAVANRTADDQNNTGLDGPEPKMDKGEFKRTPPEVPGKIKHKDILKPIIPKNRTEDQLEEIGDIERKDLPGADGDNSGFAPNNMPKGPGTKTFGEGDHASPVTRESLSSANPLAEMLDDPWPADTVVEAAFKRY